MRPDLFLEWLANLLLKVSLTIIFIGFLAWVGLFLILGNAEKVRGFIESIVFALAK